jgi:hypothetical protein
MKLKLNTKFKQQISNAIQTKEFKQNSNKIENKIKTKLEIKVKQN